MQLLELKMEALAIPFRTVFEHANASRAVTQSVLVKAISHNGIKGLGEGCPRHYVLESHLHLQKDFLPSTIKH